jgi:hypothetical protein
MEVVLVEALMPMREIEMVVAEAAAVLIPILQI